MLRRMIVGPIASSLALSAVLFTAPVARAADGAATAPASAPATPPTDAAIKEASGHYEAGLALYADGEFKRAAIEFDRAYELVPNYRALYNIGQVRIQLHEYARATKALKAYLEQGGSKIDPERKASVGSDIEMLATRTALLTLETNEAGAEVLVDGELAGTTPLAEPLLLDTGEHRLELRKAGFVSREEALTLASRDTLSMRIDLEKVQAQRSPVVVVAPQAPQQSDRTAWIWGTWSATAVFAAGAAVTGGLGISAANDLDKQRSTYGVAHDKLESTGRRAETLLRAADILGAAAIVTGGVALYLTLSKPETAKKKPAQRASLHVGPHAITLATTF